MNRSNEDFIPIRVASSRDRVQIIYRSCPLEYLDISELIDELYDLYARYDLYDLAHVAGWEPYNLPDLGQDSWVGSVIYRSCVTSHSGRSGSI